MKYLLYNTMCKASCPTSYYSENNVCKECIIPVLGICKCNKYPYIKLDNG